MKTNQVIQDGNEILLRLMESSISNRGRENVQVINPITNKQLSHRDILRIESFFEFVYLIHPDEVASNPIIHPEFLRYPEESGVYAIPEKLSPTFMERKWSRYVMIDGVEYRAAKNNVRAKYAFRDYTNVNLTNANVSNRLYGYTVAHIFGGANNSLLFSAGFNLALINDGFVKYTDEQHLEPLIYWALTSAAYRLNENTIRKNKSLSSISFLGPLIPIINNGKFQKQNYRIQFHVIEPMQFWFPIKVIKKNSRTYVVELLTP